MHSDLEIFFFAEYEIFQYSHSAGIFSLCVLSDVVAEVSANLLASKLNHDVTCGLTGLKSSCLYYLFLARGQKSNGVQDS